MNLHNVRFLILDIGLIREKRGDESDERNALLGG
jgi:hypothetical protein